MAKRGYVHRHEIINADGEEHEFLVVWLKHTAVSSFFFTPPPMPGNWH